MKVKAYTLVGLSLIVLLFSSCKKEVDKTNSSINTVASCINNENSDTIFTNKYYYASETTNDGGLVIIEKAGQLYSIIKVNSNGDVEWKNDYPEITGKYTGITTTDDAIYITSNIDFNNYSYYETTYDCAHGLFYTSGLMNCNPIYEWTDTIYHISQNIVEGTTFLTKIDYNGNFIFSKQFEGNSISNNENKGIIQSIENNQIILLTFDYYGSVPYEVVIDTINNRIDTVKYITDNNTIHIYSINSNGNVLWEKEIDNIQSHIFSPGDYPGLSGYYISANNSVIVVNLYSYIIIFDNDGNLIATLNEDRKCEYEIFYTLLLDDYLLFSQDKINYDNFTTKTDLNGNILDENFQVNISNSKPFGSNSFIGIDNNQNKVFVSDINNNIIKEKQIENKFIENILPACNNSFYSIKRGGIDDGSSTGGDNYYYVIKKEVFE